MTDQERAALWATIRAKAADDDVPPELLDVAQDVHDLLARATRALEALAARQA